MMQQPSYSVEAAAIPMSEVVRQLDFAANENMRLRDQLKQNNEILDQKLQEIESLLRQRDTHTHGKLCAIRSHPTMCVVNGGFLYGYNFVHAVEPLYNRHHWDPTFCPL